MSEFFFNLKEKPDIFEKTQSIVDKGTKSISLEGLNYEGTKDVSLKELVFFLKRDVDSLIRKGELPGLKVKFKLLKKNGKDYVSLTVFEIQTAGFYDKEKRSLFIAKGLSIFCDPHSFSKKLRDYIGRKTAQVLWSYNCLRMFTNSSDKFRFRYGTRIELEGMNQELDDKVGRILDAYMEKVSTENPNRWP